MAVTWAFKRQAFYFGILILFLAVFGFLIIYPNLSKAPSCVDNKQNGDETGVDCGGSCSRLCTEQAEPLEVLWSRAFRVVPGRYNALAYIENRNKNGAVENIQYRFRFADKDNVYIGKREGQIFIPPAGRYAVFEPGIEVGNATPVYTTFEFTRAPVFTQVSQKKIDQLKILVSSIDLSGEKTTPRLSATLRNISLFTIPDVSVVAILYDSSGNAVGASRTYLEKLYGEGSAQVNFTWPEPIEGGAVITKEIIPIFDIFRVN